MRQRGRSASLRVSAPSLALAEESRRLVEVVEGLEHQSHRFRVEAGVAFMTVRTRESTAYLYVCASHAPFRATFRADHRKVVVHHDQRTYHASNPPVTPATLVDLALDAETDEYAVVILERGWGVRVA